MQEISTLFYSDNDTVNIGEIIDILSKYKDYDINIDIDSGIIIVENDNYIALEGTSYFYYIEDFESIDSYKYIFDRSHIYSDIKSNHLIEILKNYPSDMPITVIGSDYFTIFIDDDLKNMEFSDIGCPNCFKESLKEYKNELGEDIYNSVIHRIKS